MTCERCGRETSFYMMSKFNTENCCLPCIELERKHPMYKEACEAEIKAMQNGDYNFPGIGKPADLATAEKQTFTAFLYEADGETAKDLSTHPDAESAIKEAKEQNWDEVVNDLTGDVIWRKEV